MNRDERIVVVGGGLTGLRAAERLRELKFEGEITILGDEKLPPYHRPALSKQLLQGSLRPSDLTLPAYEDLNARWRFGTQVRQLIPNKKTLVLPGGEEMTYDGLIIATGVEATRQTGVPYHDPRVLVLRTMSDGLDLERIIGSTKGRVAVIGGGFTGCELAASLRYLSRDVTLIGRGKNLLGNVLGPDLGEWLTKEHREHGVDLALGNSVEEWNPTAEGIGLKLTDGSTVMVSCVILAAGTKPMTHWLRGSGLPLDNGVVCEPTCHVVGADDVVAAGDVAQWPNLRFDNVPRRVEHWLNAVEMGRAAAENLLAGREAAVPFSPMPRFWTDQYSYRIQAAGMIKLGKDIVKLGTPDEGTGTVYGYSLEGRLMAVAGVDCPSAMIAWAESVSRQNPEPRPRIEAGTQTRTPAMAGAAATTGGFTKKRPGKHSAPPQEKQFQVADRAEQEVGFVEQPSEINIPVGVGAGPVVPGRPANVSDSFSRMLPVAVRPPNASGPQNGRPPVPLLGGRTMPGVGPFPPANQSGPMSRPPSNPSGPMSRPSNPSGPMGRPSNPSGPMNRPAVNGANGLPGGPINAPFGDGASSGAFANGSASGAFPTNGAKSGAFPANGAKSGAFPANGAKRGAFPNNGSTSGAFPAGPNGNGRPGNNGSNGAGGHNGHAANGVPTPPFGTPPGGRLMLGPATNPVPVQDNARPRVPEFSAAEMTDVSGGLPEPLAGRVGPNSGLPIDVTGQMALLDANGQVRTPQFSDLPPARRGPSDSFANMPAVPRGGDSGRMRGPEESFGSMPPVRRTPRGPEESFNRMPAVRGPQDSFGALPPVRRGADDSFSALPPARRGADDSFSSMPPARRSDRTRGAQDSFSALPPARRGADDSFSSMPPARRGADDSFSSMPPARRSDRDRTLGVQDSYSALPPARRDDDSLPPARHSSGRQSPATDDSFSSMPPARRSDRARGAEDSFSALPPARRSERRAAEASFGAMPPARRSSPSESSYSRLPAASVQDSYSGLPPVTRETGGRRRRPEDAYSTLSDVEVTNVEDTYVQGSRRAAHRAEDLTPEFGRPPARRNPDPDLSSLRLVPALSSMEDPIDKPPARMPKHGRPEDYGVPTSRQGPEDSYDRMPPVARSSGGRRRARA